MFHRMYFFSKITFFSRKERSLWNITPFIENSAQTHVVADRKSLTVRSGLRLPASECTLFRANPCEISLFVSHLRTTGIPRSVTRRRDTRAPIYPFLPSYFRRLYYFAAVEIRIVRSFRIITGDNRGEMYFSYFRYKEWQLETGRGLLVGVVWSLNEHATTNRCLKVSNVGA